MALNKAQKAAATAAAALATQARLSLLLSIVAFGAKGGFLVSSPELEALIASGQVEQGPNGENDTLGVRATEAGVAAASAAAPPVDPTPAVTPAANTGAAAPRHSAIVMGVTMPESSRGGNKGKSLYNFDALPVGGSFFIPATEAVPNPAKSLGSTASSATRRYDVDAMENGQVVYEDVAAKPAKGTFGKPDYEAAVPASRKVKRIHTRVFVMRPVADGAPWGDEYKGLAGAGVFRKQ